MLELKQPLVYIILLNYNGYKDTIECIQSLEAINYTNYKILIIDNCSTDNSLNILQKKFPQYIVLETNENIGFAGGNNFGIKFAFDNNADYVLLLNNDTIVEKNFLYELVNSSEQESQLAVTIGKIYYFNENRRIWYAGGKVNEYKGNSIHFGYNQIDNGCYDEEKYVEFATGCCLLISRDIFLKVGFLNEDYFLYYEDTDYCYKIRNEGINIKYCPTSIIYHKISSSTGRKSYLFQYYYFRNRLIFIKRHIKKFKKISAYLYVLISIIKKLILRQTELKPIIDSFVDFQCNKIGKKCENKLL